MSGTHVGEFLGFPPTLKPVAWMGAALFTVGDDDRIADPWVLEPHPGAAPPRTLSQ